MVKAYDRLEWDFLSPIAIWLPPPVDELCPSYVYRLLVLNLILLMVLYMAFQNCPEVCAISVYTSRRGAQSRPLQALCWGFGFTLPRPPTVPAHITSFVCRRHTILFANGSKRSLIKLMEFLHLYEQSSGQLISKEGIQVDKDVDKDKVKAILQMPPPQTEKEIRGFCGRYRL